MEQENIEDVIRIDREVIDEMMEVFKSFNYDIDKFNSKKTAFKNRCDIQEECSELLSEYGFILAKNNHELRKQQEAQGAAAQDEHDDVSGADVSEVSEVSGAEVSGAEVSGAKVAQPANEEEKKQRDVMTCLKDNEIIEKIKKSNHPELTLLISLSNKIKKTNYDSMTLLKKSVKEKKFTKEDVEKIFGFNFLSRNYLKMHMQNLAKEELKKKYQKQIDKIDAITNKPDATDRVRFALEFVTLWNGKKLDLPNLEVEQQDYLQKLKQRLEQRLEQRRQRLEKQRPPPSISGVFDKTKGNTPFGRLTIQTRYIIIDTNGFKWFESPDLKTKGSEKGSISLDLITGAVDAGEWNERFGVEIKHPGIEKDFTYLWCTSDDERKKIIDVVTRLTGKRSAGGKRRKTIVKYKKNKQHKYKKKTNKRRYKNKNTRKSKSLKK
jgi:hypothetical protein